MRWWNIIKSSREEAYKEFVEEYGPEVELDSLEVLITEGTNQVQIYLGEDSEWFINYAILNSGEEQFTFESMSKYLNASFQIFVEGMFEMEYPERYRKLLEMARGALPQEEQPQEEQSTNPKHHKISLLVLGRYLDCAEEVQQYSNRRIRNEFSNNTLGQRDGLLALLHPSIIRGISPEFISQQIDIQREGKVIVRDFKNTVIHAIAISVVDRTIAHPIIQEFLRQAPARAGHLRDGLISEYYELFMRGISAEEPSRPRTTTSIERIINEIDIIVRRLNRVWRMAILQEEG